MIHYCPHCDTKHHLAGYFKDPECPDILCGKRASEAKAMKADFTTRIRQDADLDRIRNPFIAWRRGQEVRVRVIVEVSPADEDFEHKWNLKNARDLLEPFDRHLVPLRDVAPVVGAESKTPGGMNVLIERCHEAIGSEDGDSLLTSILSLVAKNKALEAEKKGGRRALSPPMFRAVPVPDGLNCRHELVPLVTDAVPDPEDDKRYVFRSEFLGQFNDPQTP